MHVVNSFRHPRVTADLNTSGELSLQSDGLAGVDVQAVEADVFWCTSHLLDTIQDNYTFAQPGIQNSIFMLASLVERVDAPLHRHLTHNGVEYLQFAFRWMNNLLIRELPLRCIIRLWDTYMVCGFEGCKSGNGCFVKLGSSASLLTTMTGPVPTIMHPLPTITKFVLSLYDMSMSGHHIVHASVRMS